MIVDSPATKSLIAALLRFVSSSEPFRPSQHVLHPLCPQSQARGVHARPSGRRCRIRGLRGLGAGVRQTSGKSVLSLAFCWLLTSLQAVFDRSARGQDVPELAAWVAEAERGLDHVATNDWLAWGSRILPQRAARVAAQQQQQAAEEQALAEERERVAVAEREAENAQEERAAAARQLAEEDRQRRREALVDAMFNGSLDPEKGDRQLVELEAESVLPLPLFLRSPSPSAATSSSRPDPSFAASPPRPDPSFAASPPRPEPSAADSEIASATAALHRMSVDLTAPIAPTDSKGTRAAAVVVEFARQRTPSQGRVVVPLGPGTGRMSSVRSPVERNGAGKMMQDPPGLMPGDVLVSPLPFAASRCLLILLLPGRLCLPTVRDRVYHRGLSVLHEARTSFVYEVLQGAERLQLPARVDAEGEGKIEGEGEVESEGGRKVGRAGTIAPD